MEFPIVKVLKILALLSTVLSCGSLLYAQEKKAETKAAEATSDAKADEQKSDKDAKPDEKAQDSDKKEAKEADKKDAAAADKTEAKETDKKETTAAEKKESNGPKKETTDADKKDAKAGDLPVKVIVDGLDNPSGIAIQPETGTVFIANSGASQVVKVVDGKAEPVITDFPVDVYGKGPKYNIGPLGLLFLDKNTLVVGGGGLLDGEELLRVYQLKDDGKSIKADEMKSSSKLAEDGDIKGEGNFYALTASPDAIYISCNGDDTKGWVSRAAIKGNEVSPIERFLATKEATEVDAPVGLTISSDGYLLVGQMGEITVPNDSLLTFYDPESKEMLLNLKTNLHDICTVAYSPRKQLYVLDFAWADTTQGGLFQILNDEKSESGMRTKKILALDKPTAMAFDSDGSLYITVVGEEKKGQLLQIAPGL